ncbi:MAG: serine/threonine protein kinase, partial [Spirochaetales bacterium]
MNAAPSFQELSPDIIMSSVEQFLNIRLNGVITPYNSYVNRVYGLQAADNSRYVVKFYRPGRWSAGCVLEEHRFLFQCGEHEIPVIPPIVPEGRTSLGEACGILFSVFPLRGGRTFDVTSDGDWARLGSIVGRMHQVGRMEAAGERAVCSPGETTVQQVEALMSGGLIPETCLADFRLVCGDT